MQTMTYKYAMLNVSINLVWGLSVCNDQSAMLVALVQAQATKQYEQEFEAFQSGKYKESAQNWLQSSWQGDALQACHTCTHASFQLFICLSI